MQPKINTRNYIFLTLLILISALLNIFCSIIASKTNFPLYMDSFATIAVAAISGLVPAIFVAVLTNGTLFLFGQLKLIFVLCQLMTAVGSWLVFRIAKNKTIYVYKGGLKRFSLDSFMFAGILSAFTNGIFGSLFAAMYHYNLTAIEQGIFLVTGNTLFANLLGGFFLNLVDKSLSSFIAYGIYSALCVKLAKAQSTAARQTDASESKIKPEFVFLTVAFLALVFSFGFKTLTGKYFDTEYKLVLQNANTFEELRAYEKFISKGFETLAYSSFLLMAISLFSMQMRLNRRKNQLKIQEAKSEAQKAFARDLHDGAIQTLSALKISLSQGDNKRALSFADEAICESRELLGLSRMDLSDDFIVLAKQYVKIFEENYRIPVSVFEASDYVKSISSESKVQLLKILQEALLNAGKHSGAEKIEIKILDTSSSFVMSVCDNGMGFDFENTTGEQAVFHAGLKTMRERAVLLGGEIKIKSDGNGTTVQLFLPIKNIR